eukprot:m.31072 g.31072  ORF g.31072 m.31072 type:complete len:424 (-) comp9630_c0_seq1:352-1623(-)
MATRHLGTSTGPNGVITSMMRKTKRGEDDTGGRSGSTVANSKRPALDSVTDLGKDGQVQVPLGSLPMAVTAHPWAAQQQHQTSGDGRPMTRSITAARGGFGPRPSLAAPSTAVLTHSAAPEATMTDVQQRGHPLGRAAASDASAAASVAAYTDIDAADRKDDRFTVAEYVDDIYAYLRRMEIKFRPKAHYMQKQKDINHSMRAILVDWLVEVAEEYRLTGQTLYTAVGYIDRFLSEMSVQRSKLQLVGVTCMLLAAKYEEIYPPAVDEFVYITDNTYSREQILKMEHLVLKVLKFDMGAVTALSFLDRFVKAAHADERTKGLAMFLCELTLQDSEHYLRFPPSIVAAASICLALHTMQRPHWTPTLQHYTSYSTMDIAPCVEDMYSTFANAPRDAQQAVREKYSHPKFQRASTLVPLNEPPPL